MAHATCSIPGCEREHAARGWCDLHWKRWKATGRPEGRRAVGIVERLLTSIEVSADGCWEWQKSLFAGSGYGYVKFDGKGRLAHRLSYELLVGAIPEGLQIDHLCRNRRCVNPDHLEPVTAAVNQQRQGAIKTHCPRGHEYTEANTYIRPGTNIRSCRRCQRKGERV